MKLMTALLSAHGEWFRLQRCKDRFAGPLGVESLKEAEPESDVEGASQSARVPVTASRWQDAPRLPHLLWQHLMWIGRESVFCLIRAVRACLWMSQEHFEL